MLRYGKGNRELTKKIVSSVLMGALAAPPLIMAQEEDQLGQLSLADLLNMEITVASQKAERTSDAPGAVTAWSDQDIQKFGVNTIQELADMTPGYSSQRTQGVTTFETRGGTSALNENHLLLLDGMPIQHVRNGMAPVSDQLPLLFAKRVEFLRGPASALYGLGAFNGVMNIVPKSLDQEGSSVETKMQIGMEAGTQAQIENDGGEFFAHYNLSGQYLFSERFVGNAIINKKSAETQLGYGFFNRLNSDQMGFENNDRSTTHGPMRNGRTAHFGRLQTKLKDGPLAGLGLGFIGLYQRDNYEEGWYSKADVGNYRIYSTYIPYLRYDKQVAENQSVMAYAKLNYSMEDGSQTNDAGWWGPAGTFNTFSFNVLTKDIEAYAKYNWDITKQFGVIAGINFDQRWQDSSSFTQQTGLTTDWSHVLWQPAYTYSAFLQARGDLPVLNGLILTAGLRSDNGAMMEQTYNQISPRAAAVLKILDNLNFKAMYGTALKAPGIDNVSQNLEKANQTGIKDSIAKYGLSLKDLKAQVIQTVEGNLTYTQDNMYLSGTGFYNIISNSLQRDYIFGKERVLSDFWYNSDMKAYAAGFEVESQIAPTEALRFWVNGSYTRTWKDSTLTDTVGSTVSSKDTSLYDVVTNIPIAKSNFGVSYTAPFGLNAYLVVKGIWAMVQRSSGEHAWDNYDPGYWLVDMNLSQPLGKNFNITLGISNLLNKEYSYFRGVDPGPMRTVSLGMTSNF